MELQISLKYLTEFSQKVDLVSAVSSQAPEELLRLCELTEVSKRRRTSVTAP